MRRDLAEGILFTDQYQLSMAQLYYRMGLAEREARFEHFFRRYPDYGQHQAGYCISAGLAWFSQWVREARFDDESLEALASHTTDTGARVFGDASGWLGRRRPVGAPHRGDPQGAWSTPTCLSPSWKGRSRSPRSSRPRSSTTSTSRP